MTVSEIQNAMQAAFPQMEERVARFYAMQEYHLGWRDTDLRPASYESGKLLRPQLALLACRAVGGDAAQALPLAAAVQLIHDFSLIHDDVEDDSDLRRGRPTVWKVWGLAHGVNVGDGMFVMAHLALHGLTDAGVSPTITLDVFKRFSQTIMRLCEGQFLDISFEGNVCIAEEDYLAMISRKTAALLAGAASMGALVGGANASGVAAFETFGENLGMAFQVQDDILGIWGEPEITGKPRAADLYGRKVSLPIIHALRHSGEDCELERIYRQKQMSDADVTHVLAVLEAARSRAYCEQAAAHYHKLAVQSLDQFHTNGDPDVEDALAQIRVMTKKLLGRQK